MSESGRGTETDTDRRSPSAREERRREGGLSRRQVLALAGSGALGSAAGCAGLGGSTTATPSPEPTSVDWGSSSAERTYEGGALSSSPSSELAPADGFASVDWARDETLSVLRVTTLDSTGEGSLRRAVRQTGPRLVVFEVGGVIDLDGTDLVVDDGDCWIAGQTAPSPGITLTRGGFRVAAENVIVQHLRSRPGDELGELTGNEGGAVDAMGVTGSAANVVFDHCTATWGTDENMSDGGADGVTFSNNLIAEGLHDSIHPDGPHSFGTLVVEGSSDVSIYGNVWAHNMGRLPGPKGETDIAVVDNLAYNYGWPAVIMGGDGAEPARMSLVGNVYRSGGTDPVVTPSRRANHTPEIYVEDVVPPEGSAVYSGRIREVETKPVWPDDLSAFPASDVERHNLAAAGARPADRTPHDERLISDVREGTGAVIDSQSEVGGYPDPEPTERALDVPDAGEGLGDWLASHTAAVELADADPPR